MTLTLGDCFVRSRSRSPDCSKRFSFTACPFFCEIQANFDIASRSVSFLRASFTAKTASCAGMRRSIYNEAFVALLSICVICLIPKLSVVSKRHRIFSPSQIELTFIPTGIALIASASVSRPTPTTCQACASPSSPRFLLDHHIHIYRALYSLSSLYHVERG